MPGKETCDMFIRNVSVNTRDGIAKYCRQQKINLRDFIENALQYFEDGPGAQNEIDEDLAKQNKKLDKTEAFIAKINHAIKMKKAIQKIEKDIQILRDPDSEMKLLLELKDQYLELNEFIKNIIPDRQIPEDTSEREKLGLPKRYCQHRIDIPHDFVRFNGHNHKEVEENRLQHPEYYSELKEPIVTAGDKVE